MIPTWAGAFGLVALLLLAFQSAPAVDLVVTARMHRLRSGVAREWTAFPPQSEGPRLRAHVRGDRQPDRTHAPPASPRREAVLACPAERTRESRPCRPDEADTVTYWPIPPGTLSDGTNELTIDGSGAASDDVLIGQISR